MTETVIRILFICYGVLTGMCLGWVFILRKRIKQLEDKIDKKI